MRSNIAIRWLRVPLLVALMSGASPPDAVAQDTEDNPFTSRIDTRMGRRLFQDQCSTCHGLNAEGGNEATGPDLTTGSFRHASSDAGLYRVIRDGVPGTSMIGVGVDAQEQVVWQLVSYLRSREAANAVVDLAGSPAAGQQLFNGKGDCVRCHMVNGQGQRLGPDLSYVGNRRSPDELHSDLAEPDAEVNPRWWTMRVEGPNGQRFEGLRMDEDTFTFRIMDADENLRSFSKYGDWSYERVQTSTMPSADGSLTATERDDLVAYLYSLRRDR